MTGRYCAALFVAALSAAAQQRVEYELRFPNAAHHEAVVRATFHGVQGPVLHVVMSRSSPGRYALHEFAKNVYSVRATDGGGHVLQVRRPDPYGWDVAGADGTVVFEYTVYGDRADGTYDGIDETHAHLNMPATLVWAHGFENAPATLRFAVPEGSRWAMGTQLVPHEDGTWSAPDLEWLMDSPVELSAHALETWKMGDATFRLALHHRGTDKEAKEFAEMCKTVVLEEEGVFGAFPKYDNGTYTFVVDYLPYVAADGMEHRDSTVITGTRDLSEGPHNAIETVSHEFFHSWNVKRIRPKSLEPFDFERANTSGELWFAEGFTSYYGGLVLERAGLESLDEFVEDMGRAVNAVMNRPGREALNVVEMSRMAPFVDAATSSDPSNFPNIYISYYTYGQALGLGLDLAIRERFPGKSLDDWMREMWREHPDIDKPYTLDDLEQTLGRATGSTDFAHEVFRRYIGGKEAMPYEELLGRAGLLLRKAHPGRAWIGAERINTAEDAPAIAGNALRGSPLYEAGLDNGDRILEWNGKPLKTEQDLRAEVDASKPGERVRLNVKTRAGSKEVGVVLQEDPTVEALTYERAALAVTPEITRFRAAWLSSKALHGTDRSELVSVPMAADQ